MLLLLLLPSTALAGRIRYTVAPGDTLGGIAREYGVSVDELRRWNELRGDTINVGQTLTIRTRSGSGERVREEYTVRSGDTGLAIARRLRVSWADLQRWNPRTDFDRLRIGQTLAYYVDGGGDSTSRGTPSRGRLRNGMRLDDGNGFTVRDPARSWGNQATVLSISNGIARVQARFIDAPALVVHDLSYERGGPISPHRSHQNGLDVDISYYRTDCSARCEWTTVRPEQLDVARQWYLFRFWIQQGMVEYIFVDRDLQVPLYEYAAARGASPEELAEWFEYPHGNSAIIRHERGHDDHFHARFVAVD